MFTSTWLTCGPVSLIANREDRDALSLASSRMGDQIPGAVAVTGWCKRINQLENTAGPDNLRQHAFIANLVSAKDIGLVGRVVNEGPEAMVRG